MTCCRLTVPVLFLSVVALAGCAARVERAPRPVVEAAVYDATLTAAVTVLRDRGFVIDRHDRRYGVITTEPLGAATALEPWKRNNVNAHAALTHTLNDQRRVVTVTLTPVEPGQAEPGTEPADEADAYALGVEVQLERRQSVNRRVGGAPSNQVFNYVAATPVELRRRGIEGEYWQPVGREPALEQRIAEQITARIGG